MNYRTILHPILGKQVTSRRILDTAAYHMLHGISKLIKAIALVMHLSTSHARHCTARARACDNMSVRIAQCAAPVVAATSVSLSALPPWLPLEVRSTSEERVSKEQLCGRLMRRRANASMVRSRQH